MAPMQTAGYNNEVTTITPFCMMLANGMSRYHVAAAAVNEQVAVNAQTNIGELMHRARRASEYTLEHGQVPPIEQHMLGRSGLYRQQNIEKRKAIGFREWAEICAKDEFRVPAIAERGAGAEETEVDVEVEGVAIREEGEDQPSLVTVHDHSEVVPDADTPLPTPSTPMLMSTSLKTPRRASDASIEAPSSTRRSTQQDTGSRNTSAADYTPAFSSSLSAEETTAWNVGGLSSTMSRLLSRATFVWHVEAMDLFSINYICFGAPKFWYAIPQARSVQLENTLRSFFPRDVAQCRQFLRHKSLLASPTLLAQSSCKFNKVVHYVGEFVITFPRGFHAGLNLGLNCVDSSLDIGRKAQVLSVLIEVVILLREREEEASIPPSKPHSRKPKYEADAKPKSITEAQVRRRRPLQAKEDQDQSRTPS
ncbi:JmjC domain, hydroxylase-domain-containing protein [Phellopilus nigrolimitatus]|nr:JmjC domain, hydroxylase-domain-containing protein [Phellopilus nigrolimitatus]